MRRSGTSTAGTLLAVLVVLAAPVALLALAVLHSGPQRPPSRASAPFASRPPVRSVPVECGEVLPAPPAGQRCAITRGAGAALLLRGTVLLEDRVLHGGEVLISGGRIACSACRCAAAEESAGATVIACPQGVLSPGLINTHEHLHFDDLGPVAHHQLRYDHRHEWRLGVAGDPSRPMLAVPADPSDAAVQWGELRHVLGGATATVGAGATRGPLRSLDRAAPPGAREGRLLLETFPLGDQQGQRLSTGCAYPRVPRAADLLGVAAYLPHVAEGITEAAHNEFRCLAAASEGKPDLLTGRVALIHGISLTAADARLLSTRGAAVIWSPRSNIDLYGHTAPVVMLDHAGVTLALSTDWIATGSMNLLRELRCADEFNRRNLGGHFSDEALWRMVTEHAARAAGFGGSLGQILPGRDADLTLFQGSGGRRDHRAVVGAEPADVMLVLRAGLPLYGDEALVAALQPGMDAACEPLDVCGEPKRLCAQRETGKRQAEIAAALDRPAYPLFACGVPPEEPSCVPARPGEFSGLSTTDDLDGDGRKNSHDNCPTVFNPVRPMDRGQPDADEDGIGDACDPRPFVR